MVTPTRLADFAGGITDFITGGDPDQYVAADNWLIGRDSSLFTRPGSDLFDAVFPRPIAARISSLWNFAEDSALFAQSARQIFRYDPAGWLELTGPTGNSFFSTGTAAGRVSGSDWKGHLYLTNDQGALPMKVFRTADGTFKAVTAGLPRFLSEDAFSATTVVSANFRDLGNNIRSQMLAHFANTTSTGATKHHPGGADVTSGVGIAAALVAGDSFATAKAFVDSLQVAYNLHHLDARLVTGNRVYHSNTLGDFPGEPTLPLEDDGSVSVATKWKTLAQRLNDLKKRFNWHVRSIFGHPLQALVLTTQGVTIKANTSNGNLSLTFTGGAVAGAEVVTFFGTAISVQVQAGVSTVTQVVAAIAAVNAFKVIAGGTGLFPATPSGASAATINVAVGVTVTDLVTTADLVGTDEGPIFTDLEYLNISSFVNNLKYLYSGHASDTTSGPHADSSGIIVGSPKPLIYARPGGLAAGITNHALWVTLFDSTSGDLNSIIELTSHLYAAYRRHQQDAALAGIVLTGETLDATRNVINLIRSISILGTITPAGAPMQIENGMFVRAVSDSSGFAVTPISEFPDGATVTASVDPYTTITVSGNHNGAFAADEGEDFVFTKRTLHGVSTKIPNDPSIKAGNVQTQVDLMAASLTPAALYAVLIDLATCFNYHDGNNTTYHHPGFGAAQYNIDLTKLQAIHQYIYGFIFVHEYTTLSGEKFRVVSAPYFKIKYTAHPPTDLPTQITTMPTIANGVLNNYDTANIKIEIYRTKDTESTLFLAGSVALGVDTFTDNIADSDIQARAKLYTSGGVLDSDPPPVAKVLHITEAGIAYYGSTTRTNNDGSVETVLERIEQSSPDSPDFVNAGNNKDLPLPLVGLSSIRTVPVAFTKDGTYRLEGAFDDQGRGFIKAVTISDRVGLAASSSPVQVDGAVVFAGPDQYYLTDGYAMHPIGRDWPSTFATLISSAARAGNIIGAFDKAGNRAWWGASFGGAENDKCFVLDMNFPLHPERGGRFTTASNGSHFAPTALCFFKGDLIRGDSRGYVFRHNAQYTSDPKVNPDTTITAGVYKAIPWDYTSPALNCGTDELRKWGSFMNLKFDNVGPLSVQVTSNNDQGRKVGMLTPIRHRTNNEAIDEKRYFPAGNLWFFSKQISIKNCKVVITNSDTLGLVTVTLGTTVTIAAGTFPLDMVDHVIAFEADGYTAEFPITSQNGGNTALVCSAAGLINIVGTKWVIRGTPKTEKASLREYAIWAQVGGIQQIPAGGESGANT